MEIQELQRFEGCVPQVAINGAPYIRVADLAKGVAEHLNKPWIKDTLKKMVLNEVPSVLVDRQSARQWGRYVPLSAFSVVETTLLEPETHKAAERMFHAFRNSHKSKPNQQTENVMHPQSITHQQGNSTFKAITVSGIMNTMGKYMELDKNLIQVDPVYQRTKISNKTVSYIAKNFSWLAFSSISVARRSDGTYWAFDGQHRILAAKKCPDVTVVPCLVYDMNESKDEANAFLGINDLRKNVGAVDKFKAKLHAGDPDAARLKNLLDKHGLEISDARTQNTINCITAAQRVASQDFGLFERVLPILVALQEGEPVHNTLLRAIFWIAQQDGGEEILKPSGIRRLEKLGRVRLVRAADNYAIASGSAGEKQWGLGIISLYNKGLRQNKISISLSTD